ncbi:MAG: ABC transporter substrate-binding protein [Lachnospirales bacterium]
MKKFVVFILMVTALVGCSGEKDTSERAVAKDEVKKLIIWGGVPAENGPEALVEDWNSKNPNVQVEYVRFTNDETGNTKLDTAILSGEQIDMYFTYSNDRMTLRAEGGMSEPLTQYGADEFIKENIVGGGEGQVYINGELHGLPTAREIDFMMVNKDRLDEKSVKISNDWDAKEFYEVSKALSGEENGKVIYGTHGYYGGGPFSFANAVLGGDVYYKDGGEESNFDAPEFKYNTLVKEIMDNGYSMSFEDIYSRGFDMYCHPAFLNEEVSTMSASSWMIRYVRDLENYPHDFITSFRKLPTTEKGIENNYQARLNNHLSMSSNSNYKKESWEFIKYWLTDGSLFMLKGGKVPVWNEVNEDAVVSGVLGENPEKLFDVESFKEVMFNPNLQYIVDTYTKGLPQIAQIYKEESELYFLGDTTDEDYYNNLKTRSDEAIQVN